MHLNHLKQAVRDTTIGTGFEFVCNVYRLFVEDTNDVPVSVSRGDNGQFVSGELDSTIHATEFNTSLVQLACYQRIQQRNKFTLNSTKTVF